MECCGGLDDNVNDDWWRPGGGRGESWVPGVVPDVATCLGPADGGSCPAECRGDQDDQTRLKKIKVKSEK